MVYGFYNSLNLLHASHIIVAYLEVNEKTLRNFIVWTKLLTVTGGSSNLGSAVATSMNLTNSSEPMGAESGANYKSEPNDMMYYHTPTTDSINQTTDGFLSSLLNDEDLHLMDMAMNDGKYYHRHCYIYQCIFLS